MIYDVPVIVSAAETDCGATCLKMLLEYKGKAAPSVDELAVELHTGVNGCTAADMKRVGNKYGLDIRGYNADVEEVLGCVEPCIVWWKKHHFIIFAGWDKGKAVIINPDRGRYHISESAFRTFYSGVILTDGNPDSVPFGNDSAEELLNILLGGDSNE